MRLKRAEAALSGGTGRHAARRFGTLWLSAVSLCFFMEGPAAARFDFSNERWDSMSRFLSIARANLGKDRVVLSPQLDWGQLTPADALMVIHPETRVSFAEASAFLSAGGRLAVLDDFGKADQLLSRFHVQREVAPRAPEEMLHENTALQVARPHVTLGPDGLSLRHPIVRHTEKVVTNHPTALRTASSVELTPVLTLSHQDGKSSLFALIGVIGDALACGLSDGRPRNTRARCGRLFAMADPSVFINLMLEFEDNRDFAKGLLEYLLEDDNWGARGGKLYIVVDGFQQTGHFGGDTDLQRRLESAIDDGQQLLDSVKSDGLPKKLSLLLATLAAIAASAWAFRSSGRLYRRPIPRYAKPQPVVAQGGAPGRAAVLSAPTTHPSLIVLELKAAAEELCRQALKLPPHASSEAILSAVQSQQALSASSTKMLGSLFKQMAAAEHAVVSSGSLRITPKSVRDMYALLQPILAELTPDHRGRT